jgi:hypothetical protein
MDLFPQLQSVPKTAVEGLRKPSPEKMPTIEMTYLGDLPGTAISAGRSSEALPLSMNDWKAKLGLKIEPVESTRPTRGISMPTGASQVMANPTLMKATRNSATIPSFDNLIKGNMQYDVFAKTAKQQRVTDVLGAADFKQKPTKIGSVEDALKNVLESEKRPTTVRRIAKEPRIVEEIKPVETTRLNSIRDGERRVTPTRAGIEQKLVLKPETTSKLWLGIGAATLSGTRQKQQQSIYQTVSPTTDSRNKNRSIVLPVTSPTIATITLQTPATDQRERSKQIPLTITPQHQRQKVIPSLIPALFPVVSPVVSPRTTPRTIPGTTPTTTPTITPTINPRTPRTPRTPEPPTTPTPTIKPSWWGFWWRCW